MSRTKKVGARKMILLHEKSGSYNDYTLQPNATDAHFAALAADNSGRVAILSNVFVIPADAASYDAMLEQVVRAADKVTDHLGKGNYWNIDCARAALAAIGIDRPEEKNK